MGNKNRLCIPTLDPDAGGGIRSMMKIVYQYANHAHMDPYLVYNSTDRHHDLSLIDLLRFRFAVHYLNHEKNGMEGYSISRILPELIPLQYSANVKYWKKAFNEGDLYFGVGGNNLCCYPLAWFKKNYSCWIATPFEEDLSGRIEQFSTMKQLAYRIFLPVLNQMEKIIFRKARNIFALSEYTGSWIVKHAGVSAEQVQVVPYPIKTDLFRPSRDAETVDRKKLTFVGRINDPRKNIPLLLRAFSLAKQEYENLELVLIGSEPNRKISALCSELGITESVNFTGRIPNENLPDYYRDSSLFIIPSHQEGLCISAIESMSCGTPVISTRCGGPEQYINHGKNGLFVDKYEPEHLSNKILDLINSPETLSTMGQNARQYIVKHHSYDKMQNVFLDEFHELVETGE